MSASIFLISKWVSGNSLSRFPGSSVFMSKNFRLPMKSQFSVTAVCKSFVSEQNLKIWRCPIRIEVICDGSNWSVLNYNCAFADKGLAYHSTSLTHWLRCLCFHSLGISGLQTCIAGESLSRRHIDPVEQEPCLSVSLCVRTSYYKYTNQNLLLHGKSDWIHKFTSAKIHSTMNHEQSTSSVVTTRMIATHWPASSVVTAMGTYYWMAELGVKSALTCCLLYLLQPVLRSMHNGPCVTCL